jgi:methionyl-tRNA formyltransferase
VNLPGVLFLASHTARSQAYAQAMAAASLRPQWVLLFGNSGARCHPRIVPPPASALSPGLFLPDLDTPVADTCGHAGWRTACTAAENVNDPSVVEWIASARPRLVVYSGYGGQIVGTHALGQGAPFLHLHAGWLPDERGSTTLYYGLLRAGRCGVSAILLEREIDTGPLLARRCYPKPPPGVDVDYLYDSAIRADLLVRVLRHYAVHGRLPDAVPQEAACSSIYYVIHPVLKHLALLSIGDDPRPPTSTPTA